MRYYSFRSYSFDCHIRISRLAQGVWVAKYFLGNMPRKRKNIQILLRPYPDLVRNLSGNGAKPYPDMARTHIAIWFRQYCNTV